MLSSLKSTDLIVFGPGLIGQIDKLIWLHDPVISMIFFYKRLLKVRSFLSLPKAGEHWFS